ncbi:alpha/beta hydrolase [Bradyrhizobium prioriisuperbiae]|uniref:alpha/beta fold hydrolase n=1 Tax=Bradyrhizobium prioriisuperbiae TaxID=2854389 RepID=UPI0028ED5DF5|nr:alpha/beta hydrolase [Bradyrhizobium prioritasuperba]
MGRLPVEEQPLTSLAHRPENSPADGHIRRRTVHANGLDFPILEAGNGPLVLCLHGFPDHARSWISFIDRLAREGYRAVAPALRGYWVGGAAPDGSYRASATGQDVLALIEALGADSADLIGHDLGARAAYAAASLDPVRVRKLVGLAVPYGKGLRTALVADGDQQRRSWYMFFFQTRMAEMAVQHNDFAFLDRLWREWSPGYVLPPADRSALNETFGQPGVLTQALAYYRQLFTPPSEPETQALEVRASGPITVPSLYLHGTDDGCMSTQLSEGMEAMFTNGFDRVVMPGVGHFLHLEQPDAVLSHVLRFLKC